MMARPFVNTRRKNTCCGTCFFTKCERCVCCSLVWLPILALFALFCVLLVNALYVQSPFVRTIQSRDFIFMKVNKEEAAQQANRLRKAIQIKTVSYNSTHQNLTALASLQKYIQDTYPAIHSASYVTRTTVSKYSLLYRIEGINDTRNPYLLCAHLDVVPPSNPKHWEDDPFLPQRDRPEQDEHGVHFELPHEWDYDPSLGENVYDLGSVDGKRVLFGILEALEYLVTSNQRPKRTFYMAFGHDKEIGGFQGAAKMKDKLEEMLERNGEELDFVLDEGFFAYQSPFPTERHLVQIGVAEQGLATLDLETIQDNSNGLNLDQAHSKKNTAVGTLAEAISNLMTKPQPSKFGQSLEYDTLSYLAPHLPLHHDFARGLVLANMWLFSNFISLFFANNQVLDAYHRTTTSISSFNAEAEPQVATAVIKHHIHPSDDVQSVLQHDHDVIGDGKVKIKVRRYSAPSKVSPYTNDVTAFQVVASGACDVYPDCHVVPGLLLTTSPTDSRHYQNLTDKIYRYSPIDDSLMEIQRTLALDGGRMHVEEYSRAIQFYLRLMKSADMDVVAKEVEEELVEEGETGSGSGMMTEENLTAPPTVESKKQDESENILLPEDELIYEGSAEA